MATVAAIRHRVEDYSAWRAVFDKHGDARRQHGETSVAILRGAENPNDILVLTHWPAVTNAQAFLGDPSLKQAMANAGVIGAPQIEIYEEATS